MVKPVMSVESIRSIASWERGNLFSTTRGPSNRSSTAQRAAEVGVASLYGRDGLLRMPIEDQSAYFVFASFLPQFENFTIPGILIGWLLLQRRLNVGRRNFLRRRFLKFPIDILVEWKWSELFLIFRLVPPNPTRHEGSTWKPTGDQQNIKKKRKKKSRKTTS